MNKYLKGWTALAGVAVNVLYQYNAMNPHAWVSSLIGLLTVVGVVGVKNQV